MQINQHRAGKKILSVIIVVIAVASLLIYWQLSKKEATSNFNKLDVDMSLLSSKLNSYDLGMTEAKKYCRHDEEKFGGGLLSCEIDITSAPLINSQDTSSAVILALRTMSDKFTPLFDLSRLSLGGSSNLTYNLMHGTTKSTCSIYRYDVGSTFKFTIGCYKHVKWAVYKTIN